MYDNIKTILRLFPYIKNTTEASKLQIDKESIHYISLREYAAKISSIVHENLVLQNILASDAIITDCTACIGGNTLSFAQNFKFVHAIELDKNRSLYLENNIKVYNYNNVFVYNEDCLNLVNKIDDHTVIFIDPPWGGKDYKKESLLRLSLSNISIEQICNDMMDNLKMKKVPKLIVLKLPINYDIRFLYDTVNSNTIYLYNLIKMYIIVIHVK